MKGFRWLHLDVLGQTFADGLVGMSSKLDFQGLARDFEQGCLLECLSLGWSQASVVSLRLFLEIKLVTTKQDHTCPIVDLWPRSFGSRKCYSGNTVSPSHLSQCFS